MEIILNKDIPKVGVKGQLVKVKGGFFRNFLLPQGAASFATPRLRTKAAEISKELEAHKQLLIEQARVLKTAVEGKVIHLKEKLTKKGTLYAKVSATEICDAINSQFGQELDKSAILVSKTIKEVGEFEVPVRLVTGETIILKLVIEGKE